MDPHANVVEAASLARVMLARIDADESVGRDQVGLLAELVIALHEWRTNGGFDPYADPNAPVADPQANALLERCKRNTVSQVYAATKDGVAPGGLPTGYLLVVECVAGKPHGFECGIAPDGRVSS